MLKDVGDIDELNWTDLEEKLQLYLSQASLFEIRRKEKNVNNQNHLSQLQISALQLFQDRRSIEANAHPGQDADEDIADDTVEEVTVEKEATEKDSNMTTRDPFICPFCNKTYLSVKTLQAHIRQNHKDEEQIKSKEYDSKDQQITCMLRSKTDANKKCLKTFQRDQMGRHVQSKYHNVTKPEKMVFKGFGTDDNGLTFHVVWGYKNSKPRKDDGSSKVKSEPKKPGSSSAVKQLEHRNDDKPGISEKSLMENKQNDIEPEPEKPSSSSDQNIVEETTFVAVNNVEDTTIVAVKNLKRVGQSNSDGEDHSVSEEILNFQPDLFPAKMDESKDLGNVIWDEIESINYVRSETVSTSYDQDILFLEQNSSFGEMISQESFLCDSESAPEDDNLIMCEDAFNEDVALDGEDRSQDICQELSSVQDDDTMEVEYVVVENLKDYFDNSEEVDIGDVSDLVYNSQENVPDLSKKNTKKRRVHFEDEVGDMEKDVENNDINDEEMVTADARNEDSDYYSEDEDEDTEHRQEMKQLRKDRRNEAESAPRLSDFENNASFIKSFEEYFNKKCNLSSTTKSKDNKTISLTFGHLFHYPDSYLQWMVSQDPSFNLSQITDFKSDNFLAVLSPVDWIGSIGGPSGTDLPSRQAEKLKSHARLRDYILYRLNKTRFTRNEISEKISIREHLNDISQEVAKLKLFKQLRKLQDFKRNKAKQMKLILDPAKDVNEFQSVRKWFQSNEYKEREHEVLKDWEEVKISKAKIGRENFNKMANFARFTLAVTDKSRPSSYKFLNRDYIAKTKVYLPPDHDNLWSLESLPSSWNMYKSPTQTTPPTGYEIRLDGSLPGLKEDKAHTLIVNQKCFNLMEKYNDLKKQVFGEDYLALDQPYFVNYNGKPLSRIQRTNKGSLLAVFASVVGISDFKMTSLRKASEGVIQSRSDLAQNTKDLNCHSASVARKHYDNMSASRRTVYNISLSASEGSNNNLETVELSKEELEEKRKEEDRAQSRVREEAKAYLEAIKMEKKFVDLSPSCLSESDIEFLRTLFDKDDISSGKKSYHSKIKYILVLFFLFCTGDWKSIFYRQVDSRGSEDGKTLRDLEEKVFKHKKHIVCQELKVRKWSGSDYQNKYADIKIR